MLKSIKRSISAANKGHNGLHWVRKLKGAHSKRDIALQGAKLLAIAGVIFVVGLGIGLGIGVWVDLSDDHTPIKSVQLDGDTVDDENGGYVLPVSVSTSKRALKDYVYEEELSPETVDLTISLPEKLEPAPKPVEVETELSDPPIAKAPEPIELASIPDKPVETIPLWQRRAVHVDVPANSPMIAIVIDDVGIHQAHSKSAIALPGPLTLSFIPYGYNLQDLVNQTRGNGHEVMLHIPMEPLNPAVDPGPNALFSSQSEAEMLERLNWGLSQFGDYVGINNHMGSRFTAWEPGMRLVLREIKKRGLLFMDSVTSRDTVGFKIAQEMGVPHTIRDVFLDHVIDEGKIAKQLELVEKTARKNGYAIAIGHPHDETVNVLSKWLVDVQSRGFTLVPVSTIVKQSLGEGLAVSG